MKNKKLQEVIAIIIGVKIAIFLVIVVAHLLLPFNSTFYKANFIYPTGEKISLFTSFKTWDAQHYLYLAQNGYQRNSISNAFYPLYPLLITAGTYVTGNSLIAALLISNVLSFFAIIFFYRFVIILFNEKIAFVSTLFLLSFPTAFYFNLIYTESLFLFLTLLFFILLYQKKYFKASLISLLIPLVRVVGFFVVLPFLIKLITDKTMSATRFTIPTFNNPISFKLNYQYIFLLFPVVGFLIYLLFMHVATGDGLAGIKAGENFVGGYSIGHLLNPTDIIKNFFVPHLSLHNYNQSLIDRSFFVFYLLLLPFIYKFLPKPLFYYSLIGLTPFLGSFMGYSRYIFAVFPLFILLGFLSQKKWGVLLLPLLILFVFLQVTFVVLYALNFWVS